MSIEFVGIEITFAELHQDDRLYMRAFHGILVLLIIGTISLRAQDIYTLQGKVTDGETKESLAGVNISVKGTVLGTVTTVNGNFSVKTKSLPVTLVVSFIGYKTQEVSVATEGQPINLELAESALLEKKL